MLFYAFKITVAIAIIHGNSVEAIQISWFSVNLLLCYMNTIDFTIILMINFICNGWIMSFGQAVKCWSWHQILKCLLTFFVFCKDFEKKDELFCNFCDEIIQPFLDLEAALKCTSQQH